MKIKDILLEIEVNEWRDCFLRSIPNIKNWFKKWFEEAKIDFLTESVLPIFIDDKGNISNFFQIKDTKVKNKLSFN